MLEEVLVESDEAVDELEPVALAGSLMVSPPRIIVAPVRAGPNPAVTRPVSLCSAPAHWAPTHHCWSPVLLAVHAPRPERPASGLRSRQLARMWRQGQAM